MSTFLRLLSETNKAKALMTACNHFRHGKNDSRSFEVASDSFGSVPSQPFAYWVGESVRRVFQRLPAFEGTGRTTKQGLATADDFRFVRIWWESRGPGRIGFAKGGAFSPFYADVYLVVNWADRGAEICNFVDSRSGRLLSRPQNHRFLPPPGSYLDSSISTWLRYARHARGVCFRTQGASFNF